MNGEEGRSASSAESVEDELELELEETDEVGESTSSSSSYGLEREGEREEGIERGEGTCGTARTGTRSAGAEFEDDRVRDDVRLAGRGACTRC